MNTREVMRDLKRVGSEQTRKTYARHGVADDLFGVSYADLYKLQKRIKIDQTLAEGLWATGNHDARILATMIADPAAMTVATLETWARDVTNKVTADAVASVTVKCPTARTRMGKWTVSKREWIATTGWSVLARLATVDDDLGDEYFQAYLDTIESEIHQSQNHVRHSMNVALISIGIRNPHLQKKALAAAKRIGKVEVDHGDTSCKTPDAATYIQKAVEHRKKKKPKTTKKKVSV